MRRAVLGVTAAVIVALGASGSALATTVETFHFWGHSYPSGTKTFTSDITGSELTVNAFQIQKQKVWDHSNGYWTYNYENVLDAAFVTQPGWGIGVADYDDWNPKVDAKGPVDYLVLNLPNASWQPVSIKFSYLNTYYEDYLIYGSNMLDTSSYGSFLASLTLLEDSTQYPTAANPLFFDANVGTFQHIIIAAATSANSYSYKCKHGYHYKKCYKHYNYDDFLVKKFQGTVVPVPPALPLLATGLIALGVLRQRRKG